MIERTKALSGEYDVTNAHGRTIRISRIRAGEWRLVAVLAETRGFATLADATLVARVHLGDDLTALETEQLTAAYATEA